VTSFVALAVLALLLVMLAASSLQPPEGPRTVVSATMRKAIEAYPTFKH
jgi:hypothetical protein